MTGARDAVQPAGGHGPGQRRHGPQPYAVVHLDHPHRPPWVRRNGRRVPGGVPIIGGVRATVTAMLVAVAAVAAAVTAGWIGGGWFGAVLLGVFAAPVGWSAVTLTLTWADLGSRRAARRALDEARRTGGRRRVLVARLRVALVRLRHRG